MSARITEESTRLVIELGKALISAMQEQVPGWQRAFIRFEGSDSHHGAKGSYVTGAGVFMLDVFKFKELFQRVNTLGPQLREELADGERRFCLFLLRANSDFDYNIDFEWHDPDRWKISKMGGATGIPIGLADA